MIAIIKTLARFSYGKKHALGMGISSIVLAVSLAQLHPGLTQAQGTPQITAGGGRDAISVLQARGTASKQPYGPQRPVPVQAATAPAQRNFGALKKAFVALDTAMKQAHQAFKPQTPH